MNKLNLFLLLFSISVFLSYTLYIYFKFGVLKSISDSFYHIPHKAWFTFFQWGLSLPLIIVASTPLMFFAGSFMFFVGAAPGFMDDEMEERVHVVGATGGISLATISMWLDFHMWPLSFLMVGFTIWCTTKLNDKFPKLHVKNHTWWIEVLAYALIILTLTTNRL